MAKAEGTAVRHFAFPNSTIQADAARVLQALIAKELDSMLTGHETELMSCPRCKSSHRTKRGHDPLGRQRFLCGECGRSYTAQSANTFAGTKLSRETWMRFAECHANALSLRESATRCGVCLKTAFLMRKRVLSLLGRQALIRNLVAQKGLPRTLPIERDCSRNPARPYTVARRAGFDSAAAENAIAKCIVIAAAAELRRALRWRGPSHARIMQGASSSSSAHAALCAFMGRFRHVEERNLPGYHAWFEWVTAMSMRSHARKEAHATISAIAREEQGSSQATAINLKHAAIRCMEQLLAL